MSSEHQFERNFDYNSFLPLLLFILSIYILFLFVIKKYSQGVFIMLIAFVVYVLNNIIVNLKTSSVFNEYLEDMAVFMAFGMAPIVFGLAFYSGNLFILLVVFFYSVCQVLNLARNWVLSAKNSRGWPAPLNGIFFPVIFYIYIFYLQDPGDSVFIIYFILVGFMSISEYNFIGYNKSYEEDFADDEDKDEEKQNRNEIKHYLESKERENLKELQKNRDKEIEKLMEKEEKEKIRVEKELLEKQKKETEEKKVKWYGLFFKKKSDEKNLEIIENKKKKEEKERIENEKKVIDNMIKKNENEENKLNQNKKWYDFSFNKKKKKSLDISIGNEKL